MMNRTVVLRCLMSCRRSRSSKGVALQHRRSFGLWDRITGRSAAVNELHDKFLGYTKVANSMGNTIDQSIQLKLYALKKQAEVGPCNDPRPPAAVFDPIAKAHWQAWKDLGDMKSAEAMAQYNGIVQSIGGKLPEDKGVVDSLTFDDIITFQRGGVYTIVFNNEKKNNALHYNTLDEISAALKIAGKDDNIHCVVLKGSGHFYSCGLDLTILDNPAIPQHKVATRLTTELNKFVNNLILFKKPIIAAVNGPAFGTAVTTLGLFDLVYASHRATFFAPYCAMSLTSDACSSIIFPETIGRKATAELFIGGRKFTAQEFHRLGMVNDVFESSSFDAEVMKRVGDISKCDLDSLIQQKALFRHKARVQMLTEANAKECETLKAKINGEEEPNETIKKFMLNGYE